MEFLVIAIVRNQAKCCLEAKLSILDASAVRREITYSDGIMSRAMGSSWPSMAKAGGHCSRRPPEAFNGMVVCTV